ncbi:MAG: AsmA-like C-terminal region-containing protein, partial [Luteolibacter sp.]
LERIVLDIDKTKLARGTVHLTKIELRDARLTLPVDPKDPSSETLEISDANGTVVMPGNRRLEVRDAHGKIAGIEVKLDAQMIGYQQEGRKPPDDSDEGKRRELIAHIINELKLWNFDRKHPPSIRVYVEGDANERSSIIAKLAFSARDVEKNGRTLNTVTADADLQGNLLTVSSLRATDSSGVFEGHFDYNINAREGRFDVSSSIEVPTLLKAWAGLPDLQAVSIAGRQVLEAEGEFQLDQKNIPQIRTTGHVRCESVKLRDMPFDVVETSFSWRENQLFLRDLHLVRPDGEAHGKAMIQLPQVRFELFTTLPIPVYKPFFTDPHPMAAVLRDFSERKGTAVNVHLEGGFDIVDHAAWAFTGSGNAQNINYRGVPTNHAECKFSLNHQELDFYDGTVIFNYDNYALRNAFDGPKQGTVKIGRIRFDAANKEVEVEAVSGGIWAAPLVRLFAPKVADSLEQYRFHHTPDLKGSGVVDVTPQGRTALDVTFSSDHAADYVFLGENLTLEHPRGKVSIRGERVTISDLELNGFGGPVVANFDFSGRGRLEGELSWTKLSIPDLTSTYGFQMKGGGDLTGRINFNMTDGKVETMNGEGLMALEKAELFSVPIFGPLSPLIGGVLNNERAGFQRAKNAFFTFDIKKGILSSNDFQTSTTSLNFAGDGTVDLADRTLDMTMRMNARGLLGLITLPLRPFYGLFQFRGTGPLKDTKWENVMFTSPPAEQNKLLLAPPKAKVVAEE